MKKLILNIGSLMFASALLVGGTGAYLADSQTSSGNTFASGVVSLKFDNESYYTDDSGRLALSTTTTWGLDQAVALAGHKLFDFLDVKPGDIGEDTISVHVNNNAWGCMSIQLTSTPENGQNTPEAAVDPTAGVNAGELQNALHFAFWADDGDNVYEKGEKVFVEGTSSDIFDGSWWTLADAHSNIWAEPGGSQNGGGGYQCNAKGDWYDSDKDSKGRDKGGHKTNDPLQGGQTYYIGKAWCFGTLVADPVQNNANTGPLVRGTGFTCNGAPLGNEYQSDGITLDVTFAAVQARDNSQYLCQGGSDSPPPKPPQNNHGDDPDHNGDDHSNNHNGQGDDSHHDISYYWKPNHHYY